MKSLALIPLVALVAFVFFSSCKKESDENQKNESRLKFSNVSPNLADVNSTPFTLSYAGIHDKYLFLGVTYTGGKIGHEFFVTWDGVVKEVETKKFIDLKVYHGNTIDNGTQTITDSLLLDISNLNISNELRNDKNLYFNVINSSNISNVIVVPAVYTNDGGTTNPIIFENVEVEVVSQGDCNKGIWNSLWLKDSKKEFYYSPKSIDNSITYTPSVNDKLKITFELTWYTDSTIICNSWQNKVVETINIKALEKVK